jgi:RND family efflux transporter MFP subunit
MKTLTFSVLILTTFFSSLAVNATEAPPALVSVKLVENRPLSPKVMVVGSIHSRSQAELTSGIDGRLAWVQEPGIHVLRGDIVAKVEQTQLLLQKAQQEAQIEYENVALIRLGREFERLVKLNASNSASETELDKARSDRDLAAASLKLAQIKLKMILDNLERSEVRAPFAGIITARQHQAGEDIGGSEVIVQMTDPDDLEIRLYAPLKYSRRVSVGDELKIYHSEGEFTASIRSLIPVSDIRSQTFEARIELPESMREHFSVGELISLALPIAPKQLTTLVPRDAVVLRSSGAYVFKIDDSNKAIKTQVILGDGEGEWIAVQGELGDADPVVVRGAETLEDGQQVTLKTTQGLASAATVSAGT